MNYSGGMKDFTSEELTKPLTRGIGIIRV